MEQSTSNPSGSARAREKTWDSTITAAGMRIVRLLVGRAPQTVDQLICALGVTRTAVMEQINELVAAGFVERSCQRLLGRGRPRYVYSASDAALLLLFAGNQRLLVPAMVRAVAEVGGEVLKQRVLKRVGRRMAEHYRERIDGKTPAERLRQMMELLREEGDIVEIIEDSEGRLLINRRSCAFFSMFEESRSVCIVDEEMIARVVGRPVRRTACRHDGDPCCQFTLASRNGH